MSRAWHVLVVDDESAMRHVLQLMLEQAGYRVSEAADGNAALAKMDTERFDAILCDIRMPELDGRGLLRQMIRQGRDETIIMMSAYGTIDIAVECMKDGAFDYIAKPFKPDEVVMTLRKAEERLRLLNENFRLRGELVQHLPASELIYCSAAMSRIDDLIRKAAKTSVPVLITGETGTGKELVARALHSFSDRRNEAFVPVNASAIPVTLIESELFGHVRGAFTGAERDHPGLFVQADDGSLFLDEIGDLPPELQPKLLRVLQDGELRPVGDHRIRRVDVRVIAATARNLDDAICSGGFRQDLYYRLAVMEIKVPPLRDRVEDIPCLADFFLGRTSARLGRSKPRLTPLAQEALQRYSWPGNVRELENFLEKTLLFAEGDLIDSGDLPWGNSNTSSESFSLPLAIEHLERKLISRALTATGGNRTRAAKMLKVSLRGLLYKIKLYGLMEWSGKN